MTKKNRLVLLPVMLLAVSVACKREAKQPATTAAPVPPPIEIPAETALEARIDQNLSSKHSHIGEHFHASLAEPLMLNGEEVLPKGAAMQGTVILSRSAGVFKGGGEMALRIDSVEYHGQQVPVETSLDAKRVGSKKREITFISGGEGAIITARRQVVIPAETILSFHLKSRMELAR